MDEYRNNPSNEYDESSAEQEELLEENNVQNYEPADDMSEEAASAEDGFEVEQISQPENEPEAKEEPKESSLDDINALLASVGISPISKEDSEKELKKTAVVSDLGETKHFSLGKTATEKTRHFPLKSGDTMRIKSRKETADGDGGQMLLDGYDDEDAPGSVSEEVIEAQLQQSRKSLVENFRVLSKEDNDKAILEKDYTGEGAESVFDSLELEEGEALFDAVEKADKKKKSGLLKLGEKALKSVHQKSGAEKKRESAAAANNVRQSLSERKDYAKNQAKAQLIFLGTSLMLVILSSLYNPGGVLEFMFGRGARIFNLANILIIATSAFASKDYLVRGFESLKMRSLNVNSCVLLLNCLVFLYTLIMLLVGMNEESGIVSYSLCSVFSLLSLSATDYVKAQTAKNDIAVMMRSKELLGILPVDNQSDADVIGHGISTKGEPDIMYSADVIIPEDYEEISSDDYTHEKIFLYGTIAAAALALVFGLLRSITEKDARLFATGFVSCAVLCLPFMRNFISAILKMKNDAALSVGGAVVSGLEAAGKIGKADCVIIDSEEIFEADVLKFRAVPGSRMARSDAVVYAAAALKNTRSLIANAFDGFLEETGIRLPEAEELQYEDKLGYACWVAGKRVLVGNREMLVQHSIDAPSEEEEAAYAKNRKVLYVAVEGIVAATFMVNYRVRSDIRKYVRTFNKTGLVLMLNSGDPSLNEEFVASKLAADMAAIKIINTKSAKIIESYRADRQQKKVNGLLCAKDRKNILLLINSAHNLFEADKVAGIIHLAGLAFCFALLILCVALKISSFFTPLTIVILQLLWSVLAYYIGTTRMK